MSHISKMAVEWSAVSIIGGKKILSQPIGEVFDCSEGDYADTIANYANEMMHAPGASRYEFNLYALGDGDSKKPPLLLSPSMPLKPDVVQRYARNECC